VPKDFGISGALFAEVGSLGLLDTADKARTSFTDPSTGIVTDLFAEDDFSLRGSAGVSVFWDSPFGPVQFDFSYPFAKEKYDRTETFRFTQRTRF
jgi:outer membrane protein insertion porin family